ncbi:MAG: M3 family peptidase [Proteobacteria bacterium]|nr:MAG: M3 family peptidase [Pseudomonadota bacterium]
MSDINPLLDVSGLPRFNDIRTEHIEPAVDAVLEANTRRVARIEKLGDSANWENFVAPLEDIEDNLDKVWAPVSHLNAVMDSEALRRVHDACLAKLTAYHAEMGQNEGLYRGFKAIAEGPEFDALDDAKKKVIENALRDFRLAGVTLQGDERRRFREISERLAELSNRFGHNLLDATDAWSMRVEDPAEVAGLPESALDLARQEADAHGEQGWRFTLQAPSFIPFITYAENRDLRRQLYEAYVTRASDIGPDSGRFDNAETMREILALRKEEAALLGFDNYAEYSLETKMASSVEEVESFLLDLARRSLPQGRAELAELREFASKEYGAESVEAWDLAYYSEKLKECKYEISQEALRPWFPLPRVLDGMFAVVNQLFGMVVRPVHGVQLWNDSVRFFEIVDADGETRGRFYLDLYARERKRGGAWMADCVTRRRRVDGVQTPVAFLVCNFTPPVGDKPALLTHDEVTTLFHEFGHGLHHMLTRVDEAPVSGINGVAWDAVELPSQFMENWCWERESLDMISGHFESGEPLPSVMLEKLRAGRNFQAAMQMLRQVEFSLFDLRLHSVHDPASGATIQSVLDQVREEVAVMIPPAFNRFPNSFSHIFGGGYAAGYYSYKWAEVLSADAFSRFEENGIFDPDTGRSFLVNILEAGGTRDAIELFVAFRGREPDVSALLRHSGLAA